MVRAQNPIVGAALMATVFCAPCSGSAADVLPARMAHDNEWYFIVTPHVWAASLKVEASLAGIGTDVDVPFSDVLGHLDFALMGNVELTNGRQGAYVDAQHVRTSRDEEVFDNTICFAIRTTFISAGAFYRIYDISLGGDTVFAGPRRFGVEPTVGLRWTKGRISRGGGCGA